MSKFREIGPLRELVDRLGRLDLGSDNRDGQVSDVFDWYLSAVKLSYWSA